MEGGGESDQGESAQKSGFVLDSAIYIYTSLGKPDIAFKQLILGVYDHPPPWVKISEYLENATTKFDHMGRDMVPEMSSMLFRTSQARLKKVVLT